LSWRGANAVEPDLRGNGDAVPRRTVAGAAPLHPPSVRPFLSSSRQSTTTPFGEYDDVRILLVNELHDAVDEGVRNEGFVASALVDLTRRRLSVDDVVDTETKRAGELPAELLAEIKGAQIIPTPRCQNYLRARKRRLATCPKAQAFSIYDRCKARYARY